MKLWRHGAPSWHQLPGAPAFPTWRPPAGQYGRLAFRFFGMLSWLGLLLMVLLALWMVVNGVLLSSWAAQCWNLEKASGRGVVCGRSRCQVLLWLT